MRISCYHCVFKHLAQALILNIEAHLGYPWHRYLVIGHLAEAEAEILHRLPDFAARIREVRKAYEDGERANLALEGLIKELDERVYGNEKDSVLAGQPGSIDDSDRANTGLHQSDTADN